MTALHPETFTARWLALREDADAAARATGLLDPLRAHLAGRPGPLVVGDLGCGTGAMGRWLAGRLPGPQHWILHDRDPGLLARAVDGMAGVADADGRPVTAEPRVGDVTGLRAADLAGTSLVTASALLDLLTRDEIAALAAACTGAGVPALLTLSVVGRADLEPADPLDAAYEAAFNDHQRRVAGGRRLLGPDAVAVAAAAFPAVHSAASPWRLGPRQAALAAEWLRGRAAAAVEQRPGLAATADRYLRRRRDLIVVHHLDLLALPRHPEGGAAR